MEKQVRRKRAAAVAVTPLDVTVEIVMMIDFSLYTKFNNFPNALAKDETDKMVDLLLYYAHLNEIVSA